jgi:hypothetical protein
MAAGLRSGAGPKIPEGKKASNRAMPKARSSHRLAKGIAIAIIVILILAIAVLLLVRFAWDRLPGLIQDALGSLIGYNRGVGKFPNCGGDHPENSAGLCYRSCSPGYTGVVTDCLQNCPPEFRDDWLFCAKPAAYGRGGGWATQERCQNGTGQACESWGGLWYPKCRPDFHAFGCCICSPNCPAGMTDIGVSCRKQAHTRGVGLIPRWCPAGQENDAGLCYPACKPGFKGAAFMCWRSWA